MKKILFPLFGLVVAFLASCQKELEFSPYVPYEIELNNYGQQSLSDEPIFHNGDSLYGKVVIKTSEMTPGTKIEKIDCRLGNIVIGTTENLMECPFGVRLKDKPIGTHTFSVIIKCQSPDCDLTYWRSDIKLITIKDNEDEE